MKTDFEKLKSDFPILNRKVGSNSDLIYLDSAATSQKPTMVLEAMDQYYRRSNANIHRGIHTLAEEATAQYEDARRRIGAFVNAHHPREIVFTRNTTESVNLVVNSWGRSKLQADDLVVLTEMEHHSNLVPWQLLAEQIGFRLEFVPLNLDGSLDLGTYRRLLEQAPKMVAFVHMSNVLGTINPAKQMIEMAHQSGAVVLLDGAQSVPHLPVDVQDLDTDFLAFSAHKMCGPTGIGVLYGKEDLLESMPPFLGGGDMIKKVYLRSFTPNDIPHKFEAGTPAIAEVIGFGAAVDYLSGVGMEQIAQHEQEIVRYGVERLGYVPGLKVYGTDMENKGAVFSFTMDGVHPHDVAQVLDDLGIAVRAGHHCAMPLHQKYGLPATTRASFYLYNSPDDVDHLVQALLRVNQLFG